jgi:isopropylmalate/homocitrate/citramalate synthase
MTDEQKEQIAAEIDNEGFDYWLVNYASSSLPENNAPQHIIDAAKKAAEALDECEELFIQEGLIFI